MSQNEENETADRPGEVPAQSVEANLEADSIATQSEEPAEAHHSEPDPDPTPETGAGDAHFESESKATVSGLSDGPTMSTTSPRDGYSELKFSTDDETVNIDFAHIL